MFLNFDLQTDHLGEKLQSRDNDLHKIQQKLDETSKEKEKLTDENKKAQNSLKE